MFFPYAFRAAQINVNCPRSTFVRSRNGYVCGGLCRLQKGVVLEFTFKRVVVYVSEVSDGSAESGCDVSANYLDGVVKVALRANLVKAIKVSNCHSHLPCFCRSKRTLRRTDPKKTSEPPQTNRQRRRYSHRRQGSPPRSTTPPVPRLAPAGS